MLWHSVNGETMSKKSRKTNDEDDKLNNAWVLTTKRAGDRLGNNWVIDKLFEHNTRHLQSSERCRITSCCYPPGARLVRARLYKEEPQDDAQSLAG